MITVFLCLGGVLAFYFPHIERNIIRDNEKSLTNPTDIVFSLLSEYNDRNINGELSFADAQERAKNRIKHLHYGKNEYFWINDNKKPFPTMIMHPVTPALEGKTLDDPKFNCATGLSAGIDGEMVETDGKKNLFQAFTEVIKSKGEGYVYYNWTKPLLGGGTSKETYPKISFVKEFQPWGWIIGTGVYIDDITEEVFAAKAKILIYAAIFAALAMAFSWFMISRTVTLVFGGEPERVTEIANKIAVGDLSSRIETSPDDTSSMMFAMKVMQDNLCKIIAEVTSFVDTAASKGEFSVKMSLDGKLGYTKTLSELLNKLSDVTEKGLKDIIRVVQSLADGDLSQTIVDEYPGLFGQTKHCINSTVDALNRIVNDIQFIVLSAGQGDFTVRLEMADKSGYLKTLSELLNQLSNVTENGLRDIIRVTNLMAHGDLTTSIYKDYPGLFDQVKSGINTTLENLRNLVNKIKEASDVIQSASKEIVHGNLDLSQRTEEQATSLEETAASMDEMTATVQNNAENAKQANQLSINSSEVAEKGGTVVNRVITTMSSINESARKIVDIISVIDGIAFQTNILALNAAVEAARAGDQGRGFTVVASEVRNLAQRSATAAKEIKTLIEDSVGKVEDGTKLVNEAGQTMEEIVTSIRRVTGIMGEISAAAMEQGKGIEQINLAVTQMDDVTQRNAALVEEAAAATESLKEQVHVLSAAVSEFKINNGSGSAQSVPSLSAPSKTGVSLFDTAIAAHIKWKMRLTQFIDGTSNEQLDSEKVCKDNLCVLGQWIYGDGKTYQDAAQYSDLVTRHTTFHRCAGSIVKKVEFQDKVGAISMLNGEFSLAAKDTVTALMKMKRYVDGVAPNASKS
ncbi:methyl-accepting chemotaxis protein [Gammaproteobacteria bacterium]